MVNPQDIKICQWKAAFVVHPERIVVSKVVNLPDVTLITESDDRNTSVIFMEITTPNLSFVDAINYSRIIANRCTDILSFIVGYGVSCSLKQINEIGSEVGKVKTGAVFMSADAFIVKPEEVDMTKPSFSRILRNQDDKLARQLSHYRRGVSSTDVIDQIREYYQIIEDEYGKNDQRTKKYTFVRHLVNHPYLNDPNAAAAATTIVGKPYLDPSAPSDILALKAELDTLKNEAIKIIKAKT